MRIYKIAQQYISVSSEDEEYSELADEAWEVFKSNSIRPNRSKDISDIALDDGTVIGAVASGWDRYDGKAVFSFDIVVDKSKQGQQIGTNLVKQAIERYNNDKSDYIEMGMKTEMELEAINLRFGEFLVRQFGFEVIKRLPDRLILRKV